LNDIAPNDSVLVFGVHPDDETLAAGGLLQHAARSRARVRVTFVTDGENNPWPQRVLERRWRIAEADRRRFGARRRSEALRALATLGVDGAEIGWLALPDQGLTRLALNDPLPAIAAIRAEIEASRPTIIVGPSLRDRHPDHSGFALLLELASAADAAPRARLLHYRVHGGSTRSRSSVVLRLSDEEIDRKRRAISTYRSQLVFRGRFFRSFARDTEIFEPRAPAARTDSIHAIRIASDDGAELRLTIADRSAFWSLQPKTLLFAAIGEESKPIAAAFPITGGKFIVPRTFLRGARRLFGKIEYRWSFFDADGWREIPLGDGAEAFDSPAISPIEPVIAPLPPLSP
jgi:LmbE family N-acetylglucosaminyl deacetylase